MREGIIIRTGSHLEEVEIIDAKKVNIYDLNVYLKTSLGISFLIIIIVNCSVIR